MAEQPVDKSVQKIKFLFRLSGMNIEDRPRKWSQIFIYMFNFLWIFTGIVGAFNWMFEGTFKGMNFIELTHVTPCLNLGMMAEFKSIFLVVHEKKIHELVNNLREMERIRLAGNTFGLGIARGETKFLYPLISIMIIVNYVLAVLFVSGPLVLIAVKYFNTNELELILPFLDIYPVDCSELRFWPFAYIHQIWTTWIVLSEILAVDFLFYICCTHIGVQFKLMQHEIENVILDGKVLDKKSTDLKEKLNDFVKWHQAVISSASLLEEIYSKSTLFNYLTSTLVICLTGFNVTALDNMAIVVTFATIFFVGMMQIFFLCFFGDKLINSSTGVSEAVYNCRWYLADAAVGKSALIIQTRAQKPCKVTAAGFADVNLKAFMKILSSSWSYFALLQTVYKTIRD